ncbi:hypothetical protein GIB67_037075, partial [Kingdonia uniflora]
WAICCKAKEPHEDCCKPSAIQVVNQFLFFEWYKNHRGLNHYWVLRVHGQHTKTIGRKEKTVSVSKKR